jgi:hypothetical protein
MKSFTSKRRFSASLFAFFAAAAMPLAAAAGQPGAGPSPSPNPGPGWPHKPPRPILTVPCCHCTGEITKLPIDTGVAQWTVSPGGNPPWGTAYHLTPAGPPFVSPPWVIPSPPTSWVGPTPWANHFAPIGVYTYRLRILLPAKCFIPATYTLDGKFWADNKVTLTVFPYAGVTIGSGSITNPNLNPGWISPNYGEVHPMTFSGSGYVDLIATVTNTKQGPTGFLFQGTLTKVCATDSPNGHPHYDPNIQKFDDPNSKPIAPQVDVPIEVPSAVSGQPTVTIRKQYN